MSDPVVEQETRRLIALFNEAAQEPDLERTAAFFATAFTHVLNIAVETRQTPPPPPQRQVFLYDMH